MNVPAPWLPKVAPTVVDRTRLTLWLDHRASTPLRMVVAPAGAGKTTGAVLYARSRSTACAYVKLAPGMTAEALVAQIGRAAGDPAIRTYEALLESLAHCPPTEIIIDNVDAASHDAREILSRIFADVADTVTFMYLARSAQAVNVNAAAAGGLADICDPSLLAFDADEIGMLARSTGRIIEPAAAHALLAATHGWAIAVAGACRAAAAHQLGYDEALVYWRRTNDAAIRELVADALRFVPELARRALHDSLAGPLPPDAQALAGLRQHGLFVSLVGERLALNPLVRLVWADAVVPPADDVPPAHVEMFGRFTVTIDGQAVVWERRRDRQIIAYLAMQPGGRATRAQLIAAFWPDGDPHLARQSLRTAFCTIRQAIGACVGIANVGRYFVADHVVELKLAHAIVSARRFAELFERAASADTEDDLGAAIGYYREAERLYRSGFLAGEPPMPWAAAHEQRLARMYDRIAQRLGQRGFDYARVAGSRAPLDVA